MFVTISHIEANLFSDAGCNIKKDCNVNAACYLDEISMTHYCRCKDGYSGDGYACKEDVIGCNIIDNCGKHASCIFDPNEGGYRCKCDLQKVLIWLDNKYL